MIYIIFLFLQVHECIDKFDLGPKSVGQVRYNNLGLFFCHGTIYLQDAKTVHQLFFKEKSVFCFYQFDRLVLDILNSLAKLHKHKYIHGDIKPTNIMITCCKKVQLIDWELCTQIWPKKKSNRRN